MFPFIEPLWQDSLISLLVAINGLVGAPERSALLRPLTPSDVMAIALSLEQRSYRPGQWFATGGPVPPMLRPQAPPVDAAGNYQLIGFGAEPSGRAQISARAGGLLYEDPFYAVLAGYNLGLKPAAPGEGAAVEVQVSSREQAWAQRQQIVEDLRHGRYQATRYFALSGPRQTAAQGEAWRTGGVSGEHLKHLIFNGQAGAAVGQTAAALYGLYHYIEPSPAL